MDLASANPNSDLSALSMTLIAVVMAGQAGIESASTERPGLADNDHSDPGVAA